MNSTQRRLVTCITFLCLCFGAAAQTIKIGQVVPLSGPLANVGKEIQAATQAAFDQQNAVERLKFELVSVDDGNDPARSGDAVKDLSKSTQALLSCFGTVGCMAQMNAAKADGFPLLGPIAGAAALRSKDAAHVFAIRASATQELEKLMQFTQTMSINQLAVVVQDDGFGQSYWQSFQALPVFKDAVFKEALVKVSFVSLKPQAPAYDAVATELIKAKAQGLLLLANATHSVGVLNAWRQRAGLPFVFNLAGQANASFSNGLKGYTGAAAFVTVTPSPWGNKLDMQKNYRAAMGKAGISNLSYLGFEAYINARFAIEAFKRAKEKTSKGFKTALQDKTLAVDGLEINFAGSQRFTDLSVLRADGTYMH